MDLSRITQAADAQEKGHEFELLHPVDMSPTGIFLTIAGPDADLVAKARRAMENEIIRRQSRRSTGGSVPAEDREKLLYDFLCTIILDWRVKEKGKAVPFTPENVKRLLQAGTWVRAQIEIFAGDRSPYFKEGE